MVRVSISEDTFLDATGVVLPLCRTRLSKKRRKPFDPRAPVFLLVVFRRSLLSASWLIEEEEIRGK